MTKTVARATAGAPPAVVPSQPFPLGSCGRAAGARPRLTQHAAGSVQRIGLRPVSARRSLPLRLRGLSRCALARCGGLLLLLLSTEDAVPVRRVLLPCRGGGGGVSGPSLRSVGYAPRRSLQQQQGTRTRFLPERLGQSLVDSDRVTRALPCCAYAAWHAPRAGEARSTCVRVCARKGSDCDAATRAFVYPQPLAAGLNAMSRDGAAGSHALLPHAPLPQAPSDAAAARPLCSRRAPRWATREVARCIRVSTAVPASRVA